MRKYEISDKFTTSDIGLELEADDLNELFHAAAEGMFEIILGAIGTGEKSAERHFAGQADTPEQLLVDWLSDLLFAFDTEGLVPMEYRQMKIEYEHKARLDSIVDCFRYDPERYQAEHEIKAVTYYKLKIKRDGDIYRCHVVFDL